MSYRTSVALTCTMLFISMVGAQYDAIFVGLGTSSAIALSKMAIDLPNNKFLVLEYGGPLAKANGGNNVPDYFDGAPNPQTIFDVPGEYQNIAWQPQGDPYKITETFTWQGKGYGGNSQFNGMLFQQPPAWYLDSLPQGWRRNDLAGAFAELRSKMTVTPTPSKDGVHYMDGIYQVMKVGLNAAGYTAADTSDMTPIQDLAGYYGVPHVVTDGNAQRGGPVSAYLKNIIGTGGQPLVGNVDIINYAQVRRILFSNTDTSKATGVEYIKNGATLTATIKANGRVIVGAGGLMTPRLLYMSGIGPAGTENSVFQSNPVTFVRNNALVGRVYDHVGVNTVVEYSGSQTVTTFSYTQENNVSSRRDYVYSRVGAMAQYGPVLAAHIRSQGSGHPNVELFVNPNGPGGPATYNTASSFQAVLMLLNPVSSDILKLNSGYGINFPAIYLTREEDISALTDALYTLCSSIVPKTPGLRISFGPGGKQPNPPACTPTALRSWVTNGGSIDGVGVSKYIMNHFTGTVPLQVDTGNENVGGVTTDTLRLRSTSNVHVIDASILPRSVPAHPVAAIMAIGVKAAQILTQQIQNDNTRASTSSTPVTSSTTAAPTATNNNPTKIPTYLYYSFDQLTPNAADNSGNGRYATLKGPGLTAVGGKFGQAASFSQAAGLTTFTVNNGRSLTGAFSVATWFSIPQSRDVRMKIASSKTQWDATTGWQLEYYPTQKNIAFVTSGNKVANWANINFGLNTFVHIVVTFTGNSAELFFNGVSRGTVYNLNQIVPANQDLFIGSDNIQADGVWGVIDEFYIFTRVITTQEVSSVMNNGQAGAGGSPSTTSTVTPTKASTSSTTKASTSSTTSTATPTKASTSSTTKASTSSTAASTTSGGPVCTTNLCGASSCCPDALRGNMCYSTTTHSCVVDGANGKAYLCGAGGASCNSNCYDPRNYQCLNGQLAPK